MDTYIKLIFGIISTYGIVVLNFAIFRIRVSGKDKQIMLLALILGTTNYYFKFVQDSSIFSLTQVVVYTLALAILRKYPLLYALIVGFIGIIAASIIDAVVTALALGLNLSTIQEIKDNDFPFTVMHITVAILYLMVAYAFIKLNIGFGFVVKRFSGRAPLKSSTFTWAFFIILGLGSLQFISQNFKLLSNNGFSIIIAVVALNACVVYAYFQNKKSLVERFGETKKVGG